jgi:hypothetical protein
MTMDDLTYTLKQLCQRNRDGGHTTQADILLQRWQAEGLSAGTVKNRMAHLRWWAEKVGKAGILPRDNTSLDIPERRFVTDENKAKVLGWATGWTGSPIPTCA